MKHINQNTIIVIVMATVFGFLSGIIGYSLVGSYGNGLSFLSSFDFADVDSNRDIVIDQPRNVVVEQDLQIKQVEKQVLPVLLNIYYKKKFLDPLQQIYLPSEILGQGFVLTADGWVVVTRGMISNLGISYTAVGYQNKIYELGDFIEDKSTGLIFGKMDTRNLSVAKLGRSSTLSVGETLILISQRRTVEFVNVSKIGYDISNRQDLIQSSELLDKEIFLDFDLDNSYDGAVLVNFKGEVVGMVDQNRVIPVDYFSGIVSQVLNDQQISRPVLGIKYIDLSQVEGLIDRGESGALVYGNSVYNSPSYGQIKNGDLIKKVDDIEVSVYRSLSELINEYRTGDVVELLITRDGEDLVLDIELD